MIILSKFAIFLADPTHLFLIGLTLAALAIWRGWRGMGRGLVAASALWMGLCFLTPLGDWLLYTLEQRAPKPANAIAAAKGAIILGGASDIRPIDPSRDPYLLNDAAERLTTIIELREARPDLPILFSGGQGGLTKERMREADMVRRFLTRLGFDANTIRFEPFSRNTYENAIFSAQMLEGKDGPFLLVTSAAHMPRSLGVFRKAGLEVIPYPVDYRQWPPRWSFLDMSRRRLERMGDAMREWAGLVMYRALGRTDTLFPGPTA